MEQSGLPPTIPQSSPPSGVLADLPLEFPEALPIPLDPPQAETAFAEPVQELLPEPNQTIMVLLAPTSARRLIESVIVFVGAILFLRAVAVEPFGVPTGSMAPTLTGNHRLIHCPRCDYPIRVGDPPNPNQRGYSAVNCPNCGKPGIDLEDAPEVAGDRLLVDKNVFSLRSPRRWEAAVFRCPSDLSKPYVKRVLGLPGETILVYDGDIYIDGKLARKSFADVREARIPFYDSRYPPHVIGWQPRWSAEPKSTEFPVSPWFQVENQELKIDASKHPERTCWATYRNTRFDETTGEDREEILRDSFAYNGIQVAEMLAPVHDFSMELEVEIQRGQGSLEIRAWDGGTQLIASYPVGTGSGEVTLEQDGLGKVRSVVRPMLRAGKKYRIEISYCDRRFMFAVDGSEVFAAYDLAPHPTRAEVLSPFALGFHGISATVRELRLYRDIYYRAAGRNAVDEPLRLGSDEYFMMGDNSSNSDDSRSWRIPGVPERNFLGKPFLLHQPSRISRTSIGGRERDFPSIDWDRIRWLR